VEGPDVVLQYHGALLDLQNGYPYVGSANEMIEVNCVRNYLEPGDRTLVAGFGLGWVGLWAAYAVGPQNVVGFEANSYLAGMCQSQICVNSKRVLVVNAALVWPHKQFAHKREEELGYWLDSGSDGRRWRDATVKEADRRVGALHYTYLLQEALREYNLDCAVLDIEGAEFDVLNSVALSMLRKLIVEVHTWKARSRVDELSERIKDAGLEFVYSEMDGLSGRDTKYWVAVRE